MRDSRKYKPRNLKSYPIDDRNSLLAWTRVNGRVRTVANFCLLWLARFIPSIRLKNALYRALGVRIGRDSAVALGAMLDIFHPELIRIGDNSIVGYNAVILTHEFLVGQYRRGLVEIGDNVMIGANCVILPGVRIGNGAIVSAMSLVNRDVPAGAFAQGVPIRIFPRGRMKKERGGTKQRLKGRGTRARWRR